MMCVIINIMTNTFFYITYSINSFIQELLPFILYVLFILFGLKYFFVWLIQINSNKKNIKTNRQQYELNHQDAQNFNFTHKLVLILSGIIIFIYFHLNLLKWEYSFYSNYIAPIVVIISFTTLRIVEKLFIKKTIKNYLFMLIQNIEKKSIFFIINSLTNQLSVLSNTYNLRFLCHDEIKDALINSKNQLISSDEIAKKLSNKLMLRKTKKYWDSIYVSPYCEKIPKWYWCSLPSDYFYYK